MCKRAMKISQIMKKKSKILSRQNLQDVNFSEAFQIK